MTAFRGRINQSDHWWFLPCLSVGWLVGVVNPIIMMHDAEGLSFGWTLFFAMFLLLSYGFRVVLGDSELLKDGCWIDKDFQELYLDKRIIPYKLLC